MRQKTLNYLNLLSLNVVFNCVFVFLYIYCRRLSLQLCLRIERYVVILASCTGEQAIYKAFWGYLAV